MHLHIMIVIEEREVDIKTVVFSKWLTEQLCSDESAHTVAAGYCNVQDM